MNRSDIVESSPVQQMMMAASNPNWWNMNTTRPQQQQQPSAFFSPPYSSSNSSSSSSSSSWLHDDHSHQHLPPDSWTQLLMGGCGSVGEADTDGFLVHNNYNNIKQETSVNSYGSYAIHSHEFQAPKPPASASSPKSCVTTNNFFHFSNINHHHHPSRHHPLPEDPSPQCNSGGTAKKARVQNEASTTTQSTFKVRKEKLGDRITALHQLVSPFGKTDTASVLLEAIGYIRFLQSQIEALSLPYLATATPNMRQQQQQQLQQSVQGENNCIFPEDPGQLLNENCLKRKAAGNKLQDSREEAGKKDLRSRGLCLVPVSCTMQVGSENGADYWAPALSGPGFR